MIAADLTSEIALFVSEPRVWDLVNPNTVVVNATISRPVADPEFPGEVETKQLDAIVINDGTRVRPRLETIIKAWFPDEGWQLEEWWTPEPAYEF